MSQDEPRQAEPIVRLPLRAEQVSITKRERVRREPLPAQACLAEPSPASPEASPASAEPSPPLPEPPTTAPADLERTQPLGHPDARGTLSPTGMDQDPTE